MAFGKTTLPAVRPSTAPALVAENPAAIVPADRPHAAVTRAAVEVLTSVPTPGMTEADKRVLLGLYIKAVAGFALAVVLWTLEWLLFNNPRNTSSFASAPTVQDVRVACERTERLWRRWIIWFWFGGKWAEPSTAEVIKKENADLLARYAAARRGGDPSEPGCIVPRDLQVIYLREEIERQMPDIVTVDERTRRGYSDPLLLTIRDDVLDRIPFAAFPDGALEKIRSIRAARAEAARKGAQLAAYIDGLPDEVRAMRSIVVGVDAWKQRDEAEIIAEVDKRLVTVRAARDEAETEGGEFLGITFDDGSEWRERHFKLIYDRAPARRVRGQLHRADGD